MADRISIETAYNVAFEYTVATVWDRIWGFLIDAVIKIGYWILAVFLVFELVGQLWWLWIVFLIPYTFYSLGFELFNDGQTPGKRAMNIKVVSLDGRNLTLSQIVIRWLFRTIDFWIFSTSVSFVSAISTRKGQRIGDLSAETTVVSLRDTTKIKKASKVRLPKGFVGKYPQVSKLKDEDIELMKEVIRNRNTSAERIRLALCEKLVDYLGIPKHIKSTEYLKEIVYEFNYFALLEAGEIQPDSRNSSYEEE